MQCAICGLNPISNPILEQIQRFHLQFQFPGLFQDDKVEPEEEADEVCD